VSEPAATPAASTDQHEWYADGLRFHCTQCGNCCTGPPGAVWFTPDEGRRIADHLRLDLGTFLARYTRELDGRRSLRERKTEHGYDCIFLDRKTLPGRAVCGIYDARPTQCRTWPFWRSNLESPHAWQTARICTPCPGMNTGPLVPIDHIRIRRDALPD